jgi:hypothetical protein
MTGSDREGDSMVTHRASVRLATGTGRVKLW